jgi:ketosteroid isomerase-like protein
LLSRCLIALSRPIPSSFQPRIIHLVDDTRDCPQHNTAVPSLFPQKGAVIMIRQLAFALSVASLSMLPLTAARADEAADMAGAKAASDAFYSALAVLDDGTAMSKVWAHTPYVTFVGPRSKTIIVGWDDLAKYWNKSNTLFKTRGAKLVESHIHVVGNLAWEVGHEQGENTMADGSPGKSDWITSNVFEKQADGTWLSVSHHVQPGAPAK